LSDLSFYKTRDILQYSNSMLRSILGNAFIASLGRAANTLLGVAAVAIISRLLGVSLYGVYVLLFSYGTLVQIAADFGLYLTLSKTLGSSPADTQRIGHTVGLRLALLAVCFIVGLSCAWFVPSLRGHLGALAIVAVGLSFQSLSQLMMGVFQFHTLVWRATVSDLIGRLIQLGGLLSLLAIHPAWLLEGAVAWFAISCAASCLINWRLLPSSNTFIPQFSLAKWLDIVRQSWPFALLLFLNVIYFRIDVVMLSIFRSSAEVGWYGVAYRIIESGLFFPAMVGGLLLGRLTAAHAQRQSVHVLRLLQEAFYVMLPVAAIVLVVCYQEASAIITFISGPSFAPAGPLLAILAWALGCMLFGNIAGFTLIALDRQVFLVKLYTVLVAVNIAGNFLLIPRFGAAGAAWMTVVTELLSTVAAITVVRGSYPFRLEGWYIARVVVISAAMLLVWPAFPAYWHVIIRLMLGVSIYIAVAWGFGLLSPRYFTQLLAARA
jgi:O-antigen/teichoic acid export membrane protein